MKARPLSPPASPATAADGTRERILGAALGAFARAGFDGAGTRDIAAAAGANQGLIAYHFGGKEALWRAAIERGLDGLVAAVEAAVPAGTPLPAALDACVSVLPAHARVLRAVLHEAGHDAPRLRKLARGPLARAWPRLRALLPMPGASADADAHAGIAVGLIALASVTAAAPLLRECGVALEAPAMRRALAGLLASAAPTARRIGGEWGASRARALPRA